MKKFLKFIKNCLITAIVLAVALSIFCGWLALIQWLDKHYGLVPAVIAFILPFVLFGGLCGTMMDDGEDKE